MEDSTLNLIQKLAKIRAISDVVARDKKSFKGYYADITAILAKVTAGMKKYGVSLIPSIVPNSSNVEQMTLVNTKFDKTGKSVDVTTTELLVTADMIFKWVNDDNPEDYIEVPWFVTGSQQDPSQALGSGLTYCTRYFLCNYFQIAQPETDVDAYRTRQKEAEETEDREIAAGIIESFDSKLKMYLSEHAEQTDEIKKFIGKYAKKSNYLAIKDPAIAAKLLQDFEEQYLTQTDKTKKKGTSK